MTDVSINFRPRRRHRLANHVGKLRQRMARAIVVAFKDGDIEARCDPAKLWPAKGIWKQPRMDVFRWEGQVEILFNERWDVRSIGSWDRMSDCIKSLTIRQDGFSFEAYANEKPSQPRYRYEP